MPEKKISSLVLMDLDGTITKKDTYIEFIKFCFPGTAFYKGFLRMSPLLVLHKLGIISSRIAKERVLSYFFGGMKEDDFLKSGKEFAVQKLPRLIRKVASKEIAHHKSSNAKIVVVTASFPAWIKAWCDCEGLDLIATEYEVVDGKLSGKIKGKNCKGIEKVRRIKEIYTWEKKVDVYAYGNSKSDKEMLNIADIKYMRWRRLDS